MSSIEPQPEEAAASVPGGSTPKPPSEGRLGEALTAFARFTLERRFWIIAASLLCTALFGAFAATQLRVDNSSEGLLGPGSPSMQLLERLKDDFGEDQFFIVQVEGPVFEETYLERLRALHRDLSAIDIVVPSLGTRRVDRSPRETERRTDAAADRFADAAFDEWGGDDAEPAAAIVEDVLSLVNARYIRLRDDELYVGEVLDDSGVQAEMEAARSLDDPTLVVLRDRVLSDPALVGQLVDQAGTRSLLLVRTGFMDADDMRRVYDAVMERLAPHEQPGFHIEVTGVPALETVLNRTMERDMAVLGNASVLVMVLLLSLMFRSVVGVVGPILVVVQALVWTLGLMAFFGAPLTGVTSVLSSFLIVVGMADSIHVQAVYRDRLRAGLDRRAALVAAVRHTSVPVVLTSLTTAAGLVGFRAASLESVRDMGTYGAVGVLSALVLSLTFLPAVLTFHRGARMGPAARDRGPDTLDRVLAFFDAASRRPGPRWAILLGAASFAVAAAVGCLSLRSHHDPMSWLSTDHPARVAQESVDRHVGGTAQVTVSIRAHEGETLRNLGFMQRLEALERHVLEYRDPERGAIVTNVTSILDVVRETHRALSGDDAFRLPDEDRGLSDMLTLVESSGGGDVDRLATVDFRHALMTVRVRWLPASAYGPLTEYIGAGAAEHLGDTVEVALTGSAPALFETVSSLMDDLFRSFGIALCIITVLMVLLLRDLRLGLLAMVPNLLPIAMVIGAMGFLGLPIDLTSLLVASIALGIAVDDTIHFLFHFREKHVAYGMEGALAHTFQQSGRAMVATSIVLALGFVVFLLAEMENVRRFGGLIASTVVVALVVDLLLMPALLRAFLRGRASG